MKANEAPEKIWVHELSAKELTVPLEEYHIEYVRLDVFVEKARKFLFENYHGEKLSLRMIDNFINYMKGE